jgi:hypothetical protein
MCMKGQLEVVDSEIQTYICSDWNKICIHLLCMLKTPLVLQKSNQIPSVLNRARVSTSVCQAISTCPLSTRRTESQLVEDPNNKFLHASA